MININIHTFNYNRIKRNCVKLRMLNNLQTIFMQSVPLTHKKHRAECNDRYIEGAISSRKGRNFNGVRAGVKLNKADCDPPVEEGNNVGVSHWIFNTYSNKRIIFPSTIFPCDDTNNTNPIRNPLIMDATHQRWISFIPKRFSNVILSSVSEYESPLSMYHPSTTS